MLSSSTRKRRNGNIGDRRAASLHSGVDGLAFRRVGRLRGDRLESLGLPEDRRDVVRPLEEVLGGWEVDFLAGLRGRLEGLPDEIMQFRERLHMVRLEVVAPEDAQLVLRDLGVLLL